MERSSKISTDKNYITPNDLSPEGYATPVEVKELRRKAQILEMLDEMSKTLGTVFDLKKYLRRRQI